MKFLHDWVGIGAAAMVAAALLYFLSPWVESVLGSGRTRTLQLMVFGVFTVYGVVYFFRFVGILRNQVEHRARAREVAQINRRAADLKEEMKDALSSQADE